MVWECCHSVVRVKILKVGCTNRLVSLISAGLHGFWRERNWCFSVGYYIGRWLILVKTLHFL